TPAWTISPRTPESGGSPARPITVDTMHVPHTIWGPLGGDPTGGYPDTEVSFRRIPMRSLLVAAKAAVVVVALSTAGCLKSDDTITIYPDGSGKIDTKMTFIGLMAQMIKMGGNMAPPGGE